MAFTKFSVKFITIMIVVMSVTLLRAQEFITESDNSFVGKQLSSDSAQVSTESSAQPSAPSTTENMSEDNSELATEGVTETMSEDTTELATESVSENMSKDTSELMTEGVTETMSGDTTELMTGEAIEESKDSTGPIEMMFEESQSSEGLSASESSKGSNEPESQEMVTSEYNGFDNQKTVNGSDFSCYGRSFGQYADVSKDCRVFHLCYPFFNSSSDELLYQRITFLCDDDSVFDQKRFMCVDNSTVEHKCSDSPLLYQTTNQEYLIKVFSQNVSPVDEVNGESDTEDSTPSSSWFSWLYRN